MRSRWSIAPLGALLVAIALIVSGCGATGVPSGAVASVAGNPIPMRAYDHWLYILFKSQGAQDPTEPVIVPNDPPQFSHCISEVRADVPQDKTVSATTIRGECAKEFAQYSPEIMDFLVKGYWYEAYAHKLGINISNAAVNKELAKEKAAEHLTTPATYAAFLKSSAYTGADLLWRTRYELAYQKLQAKYVTKVTPATIASYYKSHASTFGTAETRNIRIVLAKTDALAKTALAALKHGQSFATVAKKYSTDPTTKNTGGLLTAVTKGQEEAALSNAAFAAPANKLEGPVKGQFGYYVFEVQKITAATHQSLAKATPQIKETLTSAKSSAAVATLNKKVKALYGKQTLCIKNFSMDDCHGYTAPKTTSTTAAATAPATQTGASTTGTTTVSSTTS